MGVLPRRAFSALSASGSRARRLLVGVLLGLVPLALERGYFLAAGYPYHGDALSNLFPAWHVRHSLVNGQFPIHTDLWYGGHYIPFNPLFKGFYPPAWPLFVPGVPMLPAIKVILAAHYLAVPAIAYYYLGREFRWYLAVPFSLLFALPMVFFNGHYEKVFAMPWVVLLLCQLVRLRVGDDSDRLGLLSGIAVGMTLLAGATYFTFYSICLAVPVVLATRDWAFVRAAVVGGLVGLPKLAFSVVPVLLLGAGRPHAGKSLSPRTLVAGLVGFWPDASALELVTTGVFVGEGFAPVGLPVCLLAASAVAVTYARPSWFSLRTRRWVLGVAAAGVVGVLLATKWSFLYRLPVVETFRVAARAILVVAGAALLLTWFVAGWLTARRGERTRVILALLLVSSLWAGVFVWNAQGGGFTRQTDVGVRTATAIAASDCDGVWIESYAGGVRTPYQKPIAYELTKRGVPLQAVNYGKIGQEYSTHDADGLTFDVLVVGTELPADERYPLRGGWGYPVRGHVRTGNFELAGTVETDSGPVYVYTARGACTLEL